MYTGIFYKSRDRQPRNVKVFTLLFHLDFIRKPFAKTILLQLQIRIHKLKLIAHTYGILRPVHILSLENRQPFNHLRRFVLFFQNAVHPDALQYIKEKMRIDLTVQGQKLRPLPGERHFLSFQLILINRLDQFLLPLDHPIIISHQTADLVRSPDILDFF